jgi:hypothetical protein
MQGKAAGCQEGACGGVVQHEALGLGVVVGVGVRVWGAGNGDCSVENGSQGGHKGWRGQY